MFAMAIQTQSVWMQVVGSALVGPPRDLGAFRRAAAATVDRQHAGARPKSSSASRSTSSRRVATQAGGRLRRCASGAISPRAVARGPTGRLLRRPVRAGRTSPASATRVPLRRGAVGALRVVVDAIGAVRILHLDSTASTAPCAVGAPLAASAIDLPRVLGVQADGGGPVGPGLDVRGVREWRPGDAARHVHWRSTARTGRIAVLEYGEPTVGRSVCSLPGRRLSPIRGALAVARIDGMAGRWRWRASRRPYCEPAWPVITSENSIRTLSQWHRVFALLRAEMPNPSTSKSCSLHVGSVARCCW